MGLEGIGESNYSSLVAVCVAGNKNINNVNPFFLLFFYDFGFCVPLNNGEPFPFNQPRFRGARARYAAFSAAVVVFLHYPEGGGWSSLLVCAHDFPSDPFEHLFPLMRLV